jgi:two-component system, LuxR family, response regulator FixJ
MMTPQSLPTAQPPIVAVIDDDPAVCSSLKFVLELEGFAVQVYASGSELLAADDFDACSCFVVDQRMPGMTGLELIAELRDRQVAAPAILISGRPSSALSARAAMAEVPLIEKPLLGNALVDKIRVACAGD